MLAAPFALALAVSASAPPVRLAVPGFAATGVDPEVAASLSERFSQELAKTPVEVVTDAELGDCAEEACASELANALGVDAILLGRASVLDGEYHVELKVLDGQGAPLAVYSVDAAADLLPEHLAHAARVIANAVLVEHARLGIDVGSLKPVDVPDGARPPRNALTFSPPGLLFGFFGAEYERAVNEQLSAFASATIVWLDLGAGAAIQRVQGYSFSLGARWYPWREAPSGFFVSLETGYGDVRYTVWDDEGPYSEGRPGIQLVAMLGYTFLAFERVPISLGLGGGYNVLGFLPGIWPAVRVSTGIAF